MNQINKEYRPSWFLILQALIICCLSLVGALALRGGIPHSILGKAILAVLIFSPLFMGGQNLYRAGDKIIINEKSIQRTGWVNDVKVEWTEIVKATRYRGAFFEEPGFKLHSSKGQLIIFTTQINGFGELYRLG
jgi:hypothetical protein